MGRDDPTLELSHIESDRKVLNRRCVDVVRQHGIGTGQNGDGPDRTGPDSYVMSQSRQKVLDACRDRPSGHPLLEET